MFNCIHLLCTKIFNSLTKNLLNTSFFLKKSLGYSIKYNKLKTNTEANKQKMVEANKNERANALKEVKHFCKDGNC